MADLEHLNILSRGAQAWNRWRAANPEIVPDLREAKLYRAYLRKADLSGALMQSVNLTKATLSKANLHGADLTDSRLYATHLHGVNLTGAILRNAELRNANFVSVNIEEADISGCSIYGVSVWSLRGCPSKQSGLKINRPDEPVITVDNIEVAQFVHLLLNNEKIRDVISTIGQKAVLILGRFSPERKEILDAIADRLRGMGFLPIIFDFERSRERDFIETIKILAGLSLFVIADITNPRSNPLELQATVPDYMIPFVPILQEGEPPFSMFVDLQRKFTWVLPVIEYDGKLNLLAGLEDAVIKPALSMHASLVNRKAEGLIIKHINTFMKNS